MIPLPRTNPSQRSDQLGILMRSKFHIFNIYLIRHSSVSFTPPLHPCNLNCSRAVACVVNTLPWWTPFTRCWWERGLVNLVHVDVPSNPIKPKERFISKCFDVQVQRSRSDVLLFRQTGWLQLVCVVYRRILWRWWAPSPGPEDSARGYGSGLNYSPTAFNSVLRLAIP